MGLVFIRQEAPATQLIMRASPAHAYINTLLTLVLALVCVCTNKSSFIYKYFLLSRNFIISFDQNAAQSRSVERSEEGSFEGEGRQNWRQEEEEATTRVLCHLHLQSSEAGAPRHRHQFQGDEHHEQLCQRYLRTHRCRSISSRSLQPSFDDHQSRDPDCRTSSSARRTGKARRQRRNQGCHQVHLVQVNWDTSHTSNRRCKTALFRATKFLR
jgi:hypothetical protein